jgi:hypothetical protein
MLTQSSWVFFPFQLQHILTKIWFDW